MKNYTFDWKENKGSLQLETAYGIVRKEYVVVPDKLLKNTKELKPYFDMSFNHVNSLKPKQQKDEAI